MKSGFNINEGYRQICGTVTHIIDFKMLIFPQTALSLVLNLQNRFNHVYFTDQMKRSERVIVHMQTFVRKTFGSYFKSQCQTPQAKAPFHLVYDSFKPELV